MENDALIVKEGETKFNFLMLKKICSWTYQTCLGIDLHVKTPTYETLSIGL
jgi:hypothetical protein